MKVFIISVILSDMHSKYCAVMNYKYGRLSRICDCGAREG